jgi:UDP-glucose 4-epimerase
MDVLVTGPDGLLGRRVVQFLSANHRVHAMTRRHELPAIENVSWLRHNLVEPVLPELPSRVDAVIHLAQSPYFREFPERAREIYEVGVGSTLRLLDWARSAGVKTFVYASSGGIYGHGNRGFKEDDNVMSLAGPLSFYFATKQCAELLVESYASCFTVIILRPFFIYGPCQRRAMLVPRLIRSVIKETEVLLKGQEGMRLNPIYVDDAAQAVAAALGLTRSHKINIAGPDVLTLRHMCEIIGALVGKVPKYIVEDDADTMDLVGDITRMSQLLVRPSTAFSRGVVDLCKEITSEET